MCAREDSCSRDSEFTIELMNLSVFKRRCYYRIMKDPIAAHMVKLIHILHESVVLNTCMREAYEC